MNDAGHEADSAPSPPAPAGGDYGTPLRAVMIVLALTGLAITVVLTMRSLNASALPGCGSGSPCDNVLSSPWSRWLDVPVALPAAGVWLILLLGLLARMPRVVVTAAMVATGAAVWFVYVSIVKVGELCPYCLAAHGLAVVVLVFALTRWRRIAGLPLGVAMLAVLVLAVGQLAFPSSAEPKHRVVQYSNFGIVVSKYPMLGDPDAQHVMVLFYDYTCPHCRLLHSHLSGAMERYGRDQLAIALAPSPLNAQCNPHVAETEPRHEAACGLAQAALTVWFVDASVFPDMDAWLFEADRTAEEAEAYARQLVDAEAYDAVHDDPRIAEFIRVQCQLNLTIGQELRVGDTLPKLVLGSAGSDIIVGKPHTPEALFGELESRLGLTPLKSTP